MTGKGRAGAEAQADAVSVFRENTLGAERGSTHGAGAPIGSSKYLKIAFVCR